MVGGRRGAGDAGDRRPGLRGPGRGGSCRRRPGTHGTWKTWTEAVKAATGAKGKALFMPLRLALTGREHGPELAALLPLIGPEKARARLRRTGLDLAAAAPPAPG